MSDYIKGNYTVRRKKGTLSPESSKKKPETPPEEFERRALEHLGGSISFVVKKKLVWSGEDSGEAGEKTS